MTPLKQRLRAVGLTQRSYAALLGVSERMVGGWARGEYDLPRYAELLILILEWLPADARADMLAHLDPS